MTDHDQAVLDAERAVIEAFNEADASRETAMRAITDEFPAWARNYARGRVEARPDLTEAAGPDVVRQARTTLEALLDKTEQDAASMIGPNKYWLHREGGERLRSAYEATEPLGKRLLAMEMRVASVLAEKGLIPDYRLGYDSSRRPDNAPGIEQLPAVKAALDTYRRSWTAWSNSVKALKVARDDRARARALDAWDS